MSSFYSSSQTLKSSETRSGELCKVIEADDIPVFAAIIDRMRETNEVQRLSEPLTMFAFAGRRDGEKTYYEIFLPATTAIRPVAGHSTRVEVKLPDGGTYQFDCGIRSADSSQKSYRMVRSSVSFTPMQRYSESDLRETA